MIPVDVVNHNWSKVADCNLPICIWRPRWGDPGRISRRTLHQKTRVPIGTTTSWDPAFSHVSKTPTCDRRTDTAPLKLRTYGAIQICLLLFFDPGTQFPGNEKITLCNTENYKNQAGMNLTPPPPSQNSHAVRWHCTAESERRVAEIIIIILLLGL